MTHTVASYISYDLHITEIPGTQHRLMVCCHGYGGDYRIGEVIKAWSHTPAKIVSFNFPDHSLGNKAYDFHTLRFGSPAELLPLLYVLKKYIIHAKYDAVDIYGFSAGGAAIINALGILTKDTHDQALRSIGITAADKEKILAALKKGLIILDTPLKSVEEIIACRGSSPELEFIARTYAQHRMRPLDSVEYLAGHAFKILLYFEKGDEVLSNRDDEIFIARLTHANKLGTTTILKEKDGGHQGEHKKLWDAYTHMITGALP